MQARKLTVASLTLAGLCVSGLSHAQTATDPKPATEGQMPYPPTYQDPTQPYQGQPYQGQPYQGQPYQGQPYQGQPYQGQPYQGQPYQGQPYQGQPYQGQPYQQPYQPNQPQPYYAPQPYQGQVQPGFQQPSNTVRYVNRPRVGLIVGGAITLGVGWSLSALGAAYGGSVSSCGSSYDDPYNSGYSYGGCYDRIWPLFIPVLGPWIELGYVKNDPQWMGLMVFDGLVQAGGLAMIIAGAVTRTKVAVYAKNGLQVNPLLTSGGSGLLVSGRF